MSTLVSSILPRLKNQTLTFSLPQIRSVKRDIGHLCHDEPKKPHEEEHEHEEPTLVADGSTAIANNNNTPTLPALPVATESPFNFPLTGSNGASTWPLIFPPEANTTEFSVLRYAHPPSAAPSPLRNVSLPLCSSPRCLLSPFLRRSQTPIFAPHSSHRPLATSWSPSKTSRSSTAMPSRTTPIPIFPTPTFP